MVIRYRDMDFLALSILSVNAVKSGEITQILSLPRAQAACRCNSTKDSCNGLFIFRQNPRKKTRSHILNPTPKQIDFQSPVQSAHVPTLPT